MIFRKAQSKDIDKIEAIYDAIHTQEEQRLITTGWIRGVYPVRKTAENALKRDDLFVAEQNGEIVTTMNNVTNFNDRVLKGRYTPLTQSQKLDFAKRFNEYLNSSWDIYRSN